MNQQHRDATRHEQLELHLARACHAQTCPFCADESQRCPSCGNKTFGTREGDTEYCTVCGSPMGQAFTMEF